MAEILHSFGQTSITAFPRIQYAGERIAPYSISNNPASHEYKSQLGFSIDVNAILAVNIPKYESVITVLQNHISIIPALQALFIDMYQGSVTPTLFFLSHSKISLQCAEVGNLYSLYATDCVWTNFVNGAQSEAYVATFMADWPLFNTITEGLLLKNEIIAALNLAHEGNLNQYLPEYIIPGNAPWDFEGIGLNQSEFPLNASDWTITTVSLDTAYGVKPFIKVFKAAIDWDNINFIAEIYLAPRNPDFVPPPPPNLKFGGTSMVTGEQALKNVQANHAAINVFNNNSGLGAYGFVQNQDYPIFQDNLSHYVPWATLKAFVAETLNLSWTQGSFTLPDSGGQTQKMLPSQLTAIAGELTRVEANTQDFFSKQEHVWEAEARLFEFLINEIEDRCEETRLSYSSGSPTLPEGVIEEIQTFGPFIVLTRDSESNKGYKYNNLAAWAYRSLIKTIEFTITQKTISTLATDYSNTVISDPLSPSYYRITGIPTFEKIPTEILDTAPLFSSPEIASHTDNFATWQTWMQAKFPGLSTRTIASATINNHEGITGVIFYGDDGPQLFRVGGTWGNNYSVSYQLEKQEIQISPCVTTNLGFTEIIGHGRYDALGVFAQTDSVAEAYAIPDPCAVVPEKTNVVTLGSSIIGNPGSLLTITVTIDGQEFSYIPIAPLVFPPATILLRSGSIAPIYPTKEGAYVYDLFLKKWGKMKQQYKQLLDFSPVNNISSQVYPHDIFGIQAALLDSAGNIKVFDEQPIESEIWYGKLGLYRHGMTSFEEFIAQYKRPATGVIELQGSLDGKTIDPSLTQVSQFTDQVTSRSTFTAVGRWFIIKIKGIWDLCYAEFRAYRIGRR